MWQARSHTWLIAVIPLIGTFHTPQWWTHAPPPPPPLRHLTQELLGLCLPALANFLQHSDLKIRLLEIRVLRWDKWLNQESSLQKAKLLSTVRPGRVKQPFTIHSLLCKLMYVAHLCLLWIKESFYKLQEDPPISSNRLRWAAWDAGMGRMSDRNSGKSISVVWRQTYVSCLGETTW